MFKILNGDCLDVLKNMKDNSVDSIVTDPPYGLAFMGKKWDYDVPTVDIWKECLRVLKPGGHLLAFGGTRTYHRLVVAIEDAGFEIRDQIQWIYGQGFPKSQDISKAIDKAAGAEREVVEYRTKNGDIRGSNGFEPGRGHAGIKTECNITAPATDDAKKWSGWGTALKPANEPICLARKPLSESTVAKNVLKHGTGGLNIDGTRVASDQPNPSIARRLSTPRKGEILGDWKVGGDGSAYSADHPGENLGRFPANVILDEEAAQVLDEQTGDLGSGGSGGASRFFYVAKASKSDRGEGNTHPTVKPIKLMEYLIKMVTPEGGVVLDPFMGSGTTGVAALRNNFKFRGIELDENYFYIAQARLEKGQNEN